VSKTRHNLRTVSFRAIRSVWAVAKHFKLASNALDCRMATDDAMRHAMIRCWKAGYRAGKNDAKGGT